MPTDIADASLSHIAVPLRHLAVPIAALNLDPSNARKHDEKNLSAIKGSLARFGQRLPRVVQKQGNIVRAGNGRLLAAKELGWTHIAAVVVDESEVEVTAYAFADNRTSELAEWDDEALAKFLQSLPQDIFEFTGFSDERRSGRSAKTPTRSARTGIPSCSTATGTLKRAADSLIQPDHQAMSDEREHTFSEADQGQPAANAFK